MNPQATKAHYDTDWLYAHEIELTFPLYIQITPEEYTFLSGLNKAHVKCSRSYCRQVDMIKGVPRKKNQGGQT